jgi:hypothetical protein
VSSNAEGDQYGATVAPNIAAPSHQHFFNFRIDFDVDASANRVVEENTVPVSSPSGNAFQTNDTELTTERARDANAATSRSWVIQSTTKVNALGMPTGYELVDGDTAIPYSSSTYPRPHRSRSTFCHALQGRRRAARGRRLSQPGSNRRRLTATASRERERQGSRRLVTLGLPTRFEVPVMTATPSASRSVTADGTRRWTRRPSLTAAHSPAGPLRGDPRVCRGWSTPVELM